jgi:D-3-phosphoglycerate dehydrogenase
MPSVSAEVAPRLKPYMKLAEQLGGFAGRLAESGVKSITIDYDGHVAELNTRPLTAIVLKGLLSPLMDSVNMVNAPVIARERDIEVTEAKHERASDYQTLIRVTVAMEKGKLSVAGTLFGDKPRVVDVDGIPVEAELGASVLFVKNKDKPGFIGALGRTLAEQSVNIATFHLGRKGSGDDAVALINVDQPLSPELVAKVQALPNMVQAKALVF